jgi:hypothetical protein
MKRISDVEFAPRPMMCSARLHPLQSKSGREVYSVVFRGKLLVKGSGDPECDAAQALLAQGITGKLHLSDAGGFSNRGHHAAKEGLPDRRVRRGFDYRAAVRDLTPVVRRYLSRHHRSKPERCPYLEGRRGPLFGSGSVLALRGLQRQIQRCGPPNDDPICGRARGGPVCKLGPRWSTRTGAIDLFGDGVRGRSGRVLGLQASGAMTTVRIYGSRAHAALGLVPD